MTSRIGEKRPATQAVLQKECEDAEKRLNRILDIARLKAHCSLLHGLPDRVVEELYLGWCEDGVWHRPDTLMSLNLKPVASCIELFTDYCIWLWSGEES